MLISILILLNLATLISSSESIPEYTRGKDPNWFVHDAAREDGITYLGGHSRLRVAIDKVINVCLSVPYIAYLISIHACHLPEWLGVCMV